MEINNITGITLIVFSLIIFGLGTLFLTQSPVTLPIIIIMSMMLFLVGITVLKEQ